jgi:rRNA maturation RNase YbeY
MRRLSVSVSFTSESVRVPGVEPSARRAVASVLRREGVRGARTVNVVWCSRERLRRLNRRFRSTNRFTDVIAFRYGDPGGSGFRLPPKRDPVFGDLFIASPQAKLNARKFGVPFEQELVRLVAHGTLHLLGYTDYQPGEKEKMWRVQEKIVKEVLGPLAARAPAPRN